MTIISELETIERFQNLDKLCSYIGLVPTTSYSGEKEKTGNVTPRANRILHNAIIESAWMAARIAPALSLAYNKLRDRMNANKAIIRIAKKLLNRIRYVLKKDTEYVYSVMS
jgi:transposase